MSRKKYKIALVENVELNGGGVSSVCWFLYQVISSTDLYDIDLFSLAYSYKDSTSVRLLSPKTWFKGIKISEYKWHGLTVKHIGAFFTEFEFQRYMPRRILTKILSNYDLIQIVSGSPAVGYAAKKVAKPVCIQADTTVILEREGIINNAKFLKKIYTILMSKLVSYIEKKAIKFADHIFAGTEYTRKSYIPYAIGSKITHDTIGVDVNKFQPLLDINRKDNYILSVGRFSDVRKNVGMLFESYAKLRELKPDSPDLVLAGKTGPDKNSWAKAKELGIMEHIIFKKDISFDELVNLYQHASFFVLSSYEEGLGIVLLESLACATSVVSTRCGGPNSFVTDQIGFLVPVNDADAMASKMLWMLNNPEKRREMGWKGRKMVEERFSYEAIGKKYLEIYEKLLRDDELKSEL